MSIARKSPHATHQAGEHRMRNLFFKIISKSKLQLYFYLSQLSAPSLSSFCTGTGMARIYIALSLAGGRLSTHTLKSDIRAHHLSPLITMALEEQLGGKNKSISQFWFVDCCLTFQRI
jgi:hypothetical protein